MNKILAGALYDTPSPLSVDQVSQLTTALLNSESNAVSGGQNAGLNGTDWNAVDQQAAKMLNGPQMEAWQSVENTLKWRRAMNDHK